MRKTIKSPRCTEGRKSSSPMDVRNPSRSLKRRASTSGAKCPPRAFAGNQNVIAANRAKPSIVFALIGS